MSQDLACQIAHHVCKHVDDGNSPLKSRFLYACCAYD